jgi:hypothetical protein
MVSMVKFDFCFNRVPQSSNRLKLMINVGFSEFSPGGNPAGFLANN